MAVPPRKNKTKKLFESFVLVVISRCHGKASMKKNIVFVFVVAAVYRANRRHFPRFLSGQSATIDATFYLYKCIINRVGRDVERADPNRKRDRSKPLTSFPTKVSSSRIFFWWPSYVKRRVHLPRDGQSFSLSLPRELSCYAKPYFDARRRLCARLTFAGFLSFFLLHFGRINRSHRSHTTFSLFVFIIFFFFHSCGHDVFATDSSYTLPVRLSPVLSRTRPKSKKKYKKKVGNAANLKFTYYFFNEINTVDMGRVDYG